MAGVAQIPVINLDVEGDAEQQKVARELVEAAIEHGFVYIKNTGKSISPDTIDEAFSASAKLFGSPVEEKQKCAIQTNNRGWSGMHNETLDPKNQRVGDYKEAFNFGEFEDGKAEQPLPPAIVPFQGQISDFRDLCYQLSLKINTLLGIGLEVDPPDYFREAHLREKGPSGSTLRFLYYPPLRNTEARVEDVRAGAHSDYGSITLLFRLKGQAGLEILTEQNQWAPVPVCPLGTEHDPAPPILVNIGDLLSYWTNGLLRSTVHRVIFPQPGSSNSSALVDGESDAEPRYSIAFFVHPVGTTELTEVPSARVRAAAAQGQKVSTANSANPYAERKVMTADEHLQMRLRASYLQLYKDKE